MQKKVQNVETRCIASLPYDDFMHHTLRRRCTASLHYDKRFTVPEFRFPFYVSRYTFSVPRVPFPGAVGLAVWHPKAA